MKTKTVPSIFNTVKTKEKEKAIEILQNWLTENTTGERLSTDTYVDTKTARCECGETSCMRAYFHEKNSPVAFVAYCESCGDDDAWEDDVLVEIE